MKDSFFDMFVTIHGYSGSERHQDFYEVSLLVNSFKVALDKMNEVDDALYEIRIYEPCSKALVYTIHDGQVIIEDNFGWITEGAGIKSGSVDLGENSLNQDSQVTVKGFLLPLEYGDEKDKLEIDFLEECSLKESIQVASDRLNQVMKEISTDCFEYELQIYEKEYGLLWYIHRCEMHMVVHYGWLAGTIGVQEKTVPLRYTKDTIVTVRGFHDPMSGVTDYMEECPLWDARRKASECYHAAIEREDFDYCYQVTVCYGYHILFAITGIS